MSTEKSNWVDSAWDKGDELYLVVREKRLSKEFLKEIWR